MQFNGRTIWIVGASSGIGEALAEELAAQGATVALSARREEKLRTLQQKLGAQHSIAPMDIADTTSVARAVRQIFTHHGRVDSVIVMAAAYEPLTLSELTAEKTQQIINTNLLGTFHVVQNVLPILRQQGKGQLVLCGSVAGYIGLPNGQPYSATKAAIINLAESLYAEHGHEVDIKLINPGFVKTPLTDKNAFKMPFILSPQQAAQSITRGLHKSGFEIHFPKTFTLLLKFLRFMPYWMSLPLLRYFHHQQ